MGIIRSGKQKLTLKAIIFGAPKVGKSSFFAKFPLPCFIPLENGLEPLIHAGTVPETIARFEKAPTWEVFRSNVEEAFAAEDIKSIGIDSLTSLEPLLWDYLCRQNGVTSIEQVGGGYGKGYTMAAETWKKLLNYLEVKGQETGKHVVFLAHSKNENAVRPDEALVFERAEISLNKNARPAFDAWADLTGYAYIPILTTTTSVQTSKQGGMTIKGKAVGQGERMLVLGGKPSIQAGNRLNLPDEIPFDYDIFASLLGLE